MLAELVLVGNGCTVQGNTLIIDSAIITIAGIQRNGN